jgi:hypothetical protein
MEKLTPTQKRNLLADLITLKSNLGYDISNYMGQPLSKFNWDAVQNSLKELAIEFIECNGDEYSFTYSERN